MDSSSTVVLARRARRLVGFEPPEINNGDAVWASDETLWRLDPRRCFACADGFVLGALLPGSSLGTEGDSPFGSMALRSAVMLALRDFLRAGLEEVPRPTGVGVPSVDAEMGPASTAVAGLPRACRAASMPGSIADVLLRRRDKELSVADLRRLPM